jgi:hypothetical protein
MNFIGKEHFFSSQYFIYWCAKHFFLIRQITRARGGRIPRCIAAESEPTTGRCHRRGQRGHYAPPRQIARRVCRAKMAH